MPLAPIGPNKRARQGNAISVPPPQLPPMEDLAEIAPAMAPPGPNVVEPAENAPQGLELDPKELPILRNIRAEVQDLQSILAQVRKGGVTLSTAAPYIKKTGLDIDALFGTLGGDDTDSGDTIRHIRNYWEQITVLPLAAAPENDLPAEQLVPALDSFDTLHRQMIFHIATLTVPRRLDDWLKNADPGYYVPFHMVFEDEIPDLEDRTRLLNFLAFTPRVLEYGIIDATSGLIYRIALRARDWAINLIIILVTLLVAIGVLAGFANLPFDNWPLQPANLGQLVAGFIATMVGIAIHYLIDKTKSRQAEGSLPPVFALGDIKRLLSAKTGSALIKLAMALVGLLALVFIGGIAQLTVLNAFLMGYSLDSFIGLFSTSIEERSTAQLGALKEAIQH